MLQRPDNRNDEERQRKRRKHSARLSKGGGNQHCRYEPDGDPQCAVSWQDARRVARETMGSAWIRPKNRGAICGSGLISFTPCQAPQETTPFRHPVECAAPSVSAKPTALRFEANGRTAEIPLARCLLTRASGGRPRRGPRLVGKFQLPADSFPADNSDRPDRVPVREVDTG